MYKALVAGVFKSAARKETARFRSFVVAIATGGVVPESRAGGA